MPDSPPSSAAPRPPLAPRRPVTLEAHGDTRVDPWFWLRDRDNPDVRAYLEAENAYTKAMLAHTAGFQERLFREVVDRIQETDSSAPVRKAPFQYYTRTVEGLQYAIHCRAALAAPDEEQVLLDENVMVGGHEFFELGNLAMSPDQQLMAWGADFTGGERLELRFRDLATGDDLPDVVTDTYYGLAFANDNRTVFYTRVDDAMRPYQVWRHTVGTPAAADVLVYEEPDDHYYVNVGRTRSGDFVVIGLESKLTSESRVIPTSDPTAPPRVVAAREHRVEYAIDHHAGPGGGELYIVTNADGAENFKLMVAPVASPERAHWREVVPHRPDVRLDDADVFANHLVLSERCNGLERIELLHLADGSLEVVEMPEPVYSAGVGANLEYDTTTLRFGYTSLTTPMSSYDYDVITRERTLVKRQPVLGGYDPDDYVTTREWATAPDGTQVPISVVYRRGLPLDGSAPCLLYGYGSYEISIDPGFSSLRLSLLQRGMVYAIAHIRGGGEMGRHWYEDGKFAHKPNTFTDFVASAEHLVARGYTSPDRLVARGASAGGLLMGAVTNLRPDLFRAVVAEVPFVDCVTTMLDETLPLTVTEWEEWGNPVTDEAIYRVMRGYSPYDNVEAKDYPALLVTGGLNDPRVQYWEPAKWVAKLRTTKTDEHPLLLKMEMGAGHHGPSGRYDSWRDEALVYAFVLDQVGITA
ncbi:MAG: S9 family peptidase [Acidimicrobiia bacterium]